MNKKIYLHILSLICFASLQSAPSSLAPLSSEGRLVVKNKILAKVGDRTISVLDVMKKMEVFLYRHYPQYADVTAMRHQYFASQWKEALMQMIDHELILLDAEKMELKISDAEVRETLFDRFGPNVMSSLDKIGLSYEEARAMIHSELVVQKMTWFKAQAKAISSVNTQDIKYAYQKYCEQNPPKEEWEYQVLSIRAQSEEMAAALAQKAFDLCKESPSELSHVINTLQASNPQTEESQEPPPFQISLSSPIVTEDKNLSHSYKEILSQIALNSVSTPVRQPIKGSQLPSYRIFHLKNHTKTTTPSLRSLYEKLRVDLIQNKMDKELGVYLAKLRNYYGFDAKHLEDAIPSSFQPFSLE
jgi:hypothetical protein